MNQRIHRTRQIMKTIALGSKRVHLFTLADGSSPLIVALPNEYASEVIDRVRRSGGSANVAIAYTKHFEVLTMQDGTPSEAELVINEDLSMGMLSIRLKENRGKSVRLRFRDTDADAEVPAFESELAYA